MTEFKIHYYQKALLKKLAFTPSLRFNDLLIEGLESEHMNYHLQKLMEFGLVAKAKNQYTLTDSGKDYSNLLDDQVEIMEKQPKSSIVIIGVRKNKHSGEIENLVNIRLRQPYYGKLSRVTGKIRFGEPVQAAATRELFEETGLKAKHFTLERVYHKIRRRENKEPVQDVIFYVFFVKEFSGTFIEKTEFQLNFWLSASEFKTRKDLDPFDDFVIYNRIKAYTTLEFVESDELADGF